MKENKLNIEPELGSIPTKGTTIWYIRANMTIHRFVVTEARWVGGVSDMLRLAKGNVFFSEKEANETESLLNSRLEKFKEIILSAEYKQKLEDDAANKKAEAEKRRHEKSVAKEFSDKEKALRYEVNKEKRARKAALELKKSPHPDIII